MRYRAAVGGAEEAHSRQRHWCPWSKPVNVETWGHVSGPIVMAHALAELRYGIVAHQYESGFKCGYISAQTLYADMCVIYASTVTQYQYSIFSTLHAIYHFRILVCVCVGFRECTTCVLPRCLACSRYSHTGSGGASLFGQAA